MQEEHIAYQPFIKHTAFSTEDGCLLSLVPDEHILVLHQFDNDGRESTGFVGILEAPASLTLKPHQYITIDFCEISQLYRTYGLLPADFPACTTGQPSSPAMHQPPAMQTQCTHHCTLPVDFTRMCERVRDTNGCIQVAALAEEAGYSTRHVTRLFDTYLGISAKSYCRMVRFHAVLSQMQKEPGKDISWFIRNLDYSDQAHFQREFKSYMGLTPRQYIKFYTS